MDKAIPDEKARLASLYAYAVLDTAPEPEYDRLTRLAAQICETPFSVITLVDEERQWFKSRVGIELPETDRAISFCATAMLSKSPFLVEDTLDDPRFAGNPLVLSGPCLRFYAGIPLVTPDGYALGTLAVMDQVPRRLSGFQMEALETLALQVLQNLQSRLQLLQIARMSAEREKDVTDQLRQSRDLLQIAGRMALLGGWEVDLATQNVKWSDQVGHINTGTSTSSMTLAQSSEFFKPESRIRVRKAMRECAEEGRSFDEEFEIASPDVSNFWVRVIGEAVRDADGKIVRMHGAYQNISDIKVNENILRQSQRRFRQLADAMPQIVWTADPEGVLDYGNESFSAYTGIQISELPGHGWLKVLHPDDVDACLGVWKDAARLLEPYSVECRVRRAHDGIYRWHLVKAVPVKDDAEAVAIWFGTATDIHDQKVASEEVRRLANRLSVTLESITDAFYTVDRDWRFTYVNREAERVLQKSATELIGKVLWQEFPKFAASDYQGEFRRAIAENCALDYETFYEPLEIWLEVHAYPSEEGLAVYFSDITERKQAHERIRESEERFKNVAKAATDAIWDWDFSTDKIWWNEGMQILFGFPVEEIEPTGESWTNRIHQDDRERVIASITAAIACAGNGQSENWAEEYRFRHRDGSYAYVLDRGFVIRDDAGHPVRMVGGMTDLTARKQSEIELARLNRALRIRGACSDALIRATDESQLLSEICHLAVEGGYSMAWVGYAQDDETCSITPAAYAGKSDAAEFLAGSWRSWSEDSAAGQGPAGRAIRGGQPVVLEDVMQDASYAPWLASAQQLDYRGVISLPLRDKNAVFGLLVLYLTEVRTVAADEVELLQEIADNLAFGIQNLRAQKDRQRLQLAVQKVAAGVSASSGAEFFKQLTFSMVEVLDADAGFIAHFKDNDLSSARTIVAMVDGELRENFDYVLANSPCESLAIETDCVVPLNLDKLFPFSPAVADLGMQSYVGRRLDNAAGKPMGLLFVMFRKFLKAPEFTSSTLRIFAARAASELERQESDRQLRDQASLLDKAQDAIVVRGMDNRILFWNKGAERLYGWTPEQAVGMTVDELLYNDVSVLRQATSVVLMLGEWNGELTQRRRDGSILIVEARWTLVRDADGNPQSVLAINTDITQRKAAEQEIQHLAFYDPLTKLPNRLLLMDRLQHAMASSQRSRNMGGLLFLDLDNFKSLNDTLGHDKGDLLLRQVAARLTCCVRSADTVARIGGDEFVIMLVDLSEDLHDAAAQASAVGEKILEVFNYPFELAGYEHHSTPSIGVTLFNGETNTLDDLLKRADLAMYQAKASGRNAMRFFDPEMQSVMSARVALEADFRHSLQQQDFVLYYQPQIDAYGNISGAEALVRWKHPQRGLVSPAEFIPLAEDTGLIIGLGRWVLETACLQLTQWANKPHTANFSMSVNVSVRQFRHPDFVEQLMQILAKTGADPQRLTLELTESLFVDEMEAAIDKMLALKSLKINFSLDDFGTGYSSLSYLKRMPLDQLKIDPSFVQDVLTDPNDAVIVRTIIALAQSLGLDVTAEGVETREQYAFLAENGCFAYQGYLFSRPLPIEDFEVMLLQHIPS